MNNIPLHVVTNILFGIFSALTAILILFYKKNFSFHNGIAIMLIAFGVLSISDGIIHLSYSLVSYKFYFLSRCIIPIFTLQFSEYVLRISYSIIIKLSVLIPTIFLGILAFFQTSLGNILYENFVDAFLISTLLLILFKTLANLITSKHALLQKYLMIFFVTILVVVVNECFRKFSDSFYNLYSVGIISMVVSHGVVLIITSGGYGLLIQKIPKIINIFILSSVLCFSLNLFQNTIAPNYLQTLFIISFFLFSLNYMIGEVSKNPKEIRASYLITRILNLPINDKSIFIEELRAWDEISDLHIIDNSKIEGNVQHLNLLFQKTGRVIHKYQIAELSKVLDYNANFLSGLDIAKYYLKKMDCNSLFQLNDKGDFLAIKYISGLNPALYSNELSMMSKIVFSISNIQKAN